MTQPVVPGSGRVVPITLRGARYLALEDHDRVGGQPVRATYVAVMRYGPVKAIGLKPALGRRLR